MFRAKIVGPDQKYHVFSMLYCRERSLVAGKVTKTLCQVPALMETGLTFRAFPWYFRIMSALPKIPVRMTVAEFLAWNPPTPQLWQLVDGEPQAMAPASRTHGAIQSELGSLIRNHLAESGGPCSIITTPGVIPHVQSDTNIRIPDSRLPARVTIQKNWPSPIRSS